MPRDSDKQDETAGKNRITELYKRYRPRTLDDVVGQDAAVKQLRKMLDDGTTEHLILFSGPSGCGKTTLARIVARGLGCRRLDFQELNAAGQFRGIDTVRQIGGEMGMAPGESKVRVWLIDEAHQMTGAAQQAMLKMTEDTPEWVYFMLATTDPGKIVKTLRNRAAEIVLRPFSLDTMTELITRVLKGEGRKGAVTKDVIERIYEASDSSPRKALVLLGQALRFDSEDDQLAVIQSGPEHPAAFDLCKALLPWDSRQRGGWSGVGQLLDKLKDAGEDAEGLRHMLLANARSLLVRGKNGFHHKLGAVCIDCLRQPFFDKNSGHALLAVAAYEICHAKV